MKFKFSSYLFALIYSSYCNSHFYFNWKRFDHWKLRRSSLQSRTSFQSFIREFYILITIFFRFVFWNQELYLLTIDIRDDMKRSWQAIMLIHRWAFKLLKIQEPGRLTQLENWFWHFCTKFWTKCFINFELMAFFVKTDFRHFSYWPPNIFKVLLFPVKKRHKVLRNHDTFSSKSFFCRLYNRYYLVKSINLQVAFFLKLWPWRAGWFRPTKGRKVVLW